MPLAVTKSPFYCKLPVARSLCSLMFPSYFTRLMCVDLWNAVPHTKKANTRPPQGWPIYGTQNMV